jgi:hypothetical protein
MADLGIYGQYYRPILVFTQIFGVCTINGKSPVLQGIITPPNPLFGPIT